MRASFVLLLLALAAAAPAMADINFNYPMVPYANPRGPSINAGPGGPMIPNSQGTPTPPPVGCVGVADFGDGCAIAVFGH